MSDLFAWTLDTDERFALFTGAAYDDEGEEIFPFQYDTPLPEGTVLNLERPRRGELSDFLFNTRHLLYVSQRALDVMTGDAFDGVIPYPVILRDRKGEVAGPPYFWLRVPVVAAILDRERSDFDRSNPKFIRRIETFVVKEEAVPPQTVFLCDETAAPVFRKPLVDAIQAERLTGARFLPLDGLRWPT